MNAEHNTEFARLTADVVVQGYRDGQLHVLVIRRRWAPFAERWALPGGHVDPGEDTRDAAGRELREETGLDVADLSLVGVFAAPGRDPRGRYVTFAYAAVLQGDPPEPEAADDAADARWIPTADLLAEPDLLAFDHGQIIRDAVLRTAARPAPVAK